MSKKTVETMVDGQFATLEIQESKPLSKSKTARTNALATIIGVLSLVAVYAVDLEKILQESTTLELTPDTIWLVGVILSILGPANIVLRYITDSPITPIFSKKGKI